MHAAHLSPARSVVVQALWGLAVLFGLGGVAHAADTWTNVTTGVDHLHRVETGSLPQNIHVARVDLTRPLVSVHASNDVSTERGVSTRTFADNAGAVVAINGDWGETRRTPISLAMGDGNLWNPHFTDPSVGGEWGFFACDIFNNCEAGTRPVADLGFVTPFLAPYRYFNAVGGNGLILLDDGVRGVGCYDTVRNPRSGVCVDASRETLFLIAVDGRRSSASGMTCDEMRDLAVDLGCHDATMLDGGGSTTLVVDGSVVNSPSDGSLRSRPNHLGVVVAASEDSACSSLSSGRWCDGTEVHTCSGGRYLGGGDCAAYGASCEEDGDWAYCVHYQCPDGDGNGSTCLSATEIRSCNDGWLSEGDCAAFGAVCGEDAAGADCMDARCSSGPHAGFCIDETTVAQCTDGLYAETSCTGDTVCSVDGLVAACTEPASEDSGTTDGATDGTTGGGDASGGPSGDADGSLGSTDTPELDEGSESSGCATLGSVPGGIAGLLGGLALVGVVRRRSA